MNSALNTASICNYPLPDRMCGEPAPYTCDVTVTHDDGKPGGTVYQAHFCETHMLELLFKVREPDQPSARQQK